MKKKLAMSVAVVLGFSAAAHASEQEGWQFELAPYFWWANVKDDVKVGDQKFKIDNNTWENLESGFMGFGVISYDRFVFYLDDDYLSLSGDKGRAKNGVLVPAGTEVKGDFDINLVTGAIGYRFDTWGNNAWVDVLVGARNARVNRDIKVLNQKFSKDEDVTDAVLLLRPSFGFADNWRFTGLFGGGGSSSSHTYELMPQFQYDFTETFSVRFGYKRIYYNIDSGHNHTPDYREFDGSFSGPFLGVGFKFPTPEKHVAAVPAALPPPPAKCADSDNDGVCDDKDACPNTPPGKRVGANGCDCDFTMMTHFAFNSAELTAEDKAQLDKLTDVLADPRLAFVSGVIEGHTDSVGKPAYNVKLSYRRAEAVKEYLASKGVSMNNAIVSGKGEEDPIADNKTEEGRAQNRRVVIRRTDCGPAQ